MLFITQFCIKPQLAVDDVNIDRIQCDCTPKYLSIILRKNSNLYNLNLYLHYIYGIIQYFTPILWWTMISNKKYLLLREVV